MEISGLSAKAFQYALYLI